MDIKQIQELVKLINKTNIGEITIEEEGVKITVKQKKDPVQHIIAGGHQAPMFSAPAATSPMIGTFYRQSGPGKPIFINEGDDVIPGSIVCIIEAMKLFNEIESEVKGKIVKILVDDASPVEFDQPLFLVDPS